MNKPVDCSKTIWIFATNLVDQQIIDFYDEWLDGKSAADREKAPYAVLQGAVMPVLRDKFKVCSSFTVETPDHDLLTPPEFDWAPYKLHPFLSLHP